MSEAKIILSTLNAKYVHASLGLRYLYANMRSLQSQTQIIEFSINGQIGEMAEQLIAEKPNIVGFGVYIWNVAQTLALIRLLKVLNPNLVIVLGGPEVSYEWQQQEIVQLADYLITGQGDKQFAELCEQIIFSNECQEQNHQSRIQKVFSGQVRDLNALELPYAFYSDEDIQHRLIYVEASRGCPFKCEFCLSALDKTAYPFDIDKFLAEMEKLYVRGARRFKFVDRTFNLKISESLKILEFFLQRMDESLFLHFEIIPDRLPEQLKSTIQKFPEGTLQFEIGIQTFNPTIQEIISRKQDNEKSKQNLLWLRKNSHAHLHTDLIFGLPGEDMQSFSMGFQQLVELQPHDIQIGILKRLKGTPIIRHSQTYQLIFNPNPPFEIVSTDCINYEQLRAMTRFARYWEMIANSGRFKHALAILLENKPFEQFYALSEWIFSTTGRTHKFSLRSLFDLLYEGGCLLGIDSKRLWDGLWLDYQAAGLKGKPEFMKPHFKGVA